MGKHVNMDQGIEYYLALNNVKNVGPVLFKNLVSYCGGIKQVFDASNRTLSKIPSVGPILSKQIADANVLEWAQKELEWCQREEIQIVTYLNDNYPQRLTHYKDCPPILYIKGNVNTNALRTVAIVGTRSASTYGRDITEKIIEEIKTYDVQIISGMAYGIDITAHRCSNHLGVPTIGILGNGLDKVYPGAHESVSKKMMKTGGLISEFPLGSKPDREHFPMRNRIIAGMSDSIVVIESKESGGSMITADLGFNYNKDVFAVPGRVGDDRSAGCLKLIKSNKAALIESGQDLAKAMMWEEKSANLTMQRSLFADLNDTETKVVDILKIHESVHVDKLVQMMNITGGNMAGILLQLELKNVIKALPGKHFTLAR